MNTMINPNDKAMEIIKAYVKEQLDKATPVLDFNVFEMIYNEDNEAWYKKEWYIDEK